MATKPPKDESDELEAFSMELDREHGFVEIVIRRATPYRYPWSEVLSRVDPAAFREEVLAWSSYQKETKKRGASTWLVDDDSKDYLAKLTALCGRNRVIPFVGAGMSLDSGFELWGAFIEREAKRRRRRKARTLLRQGLYEDALDHLLVHDENLVQTAIDSTFGRSDFTLAGPVTLLPQLFRTGIITTNFDNVIEEAFAAVRRTIVVRQGNRPQDIIRLLKEGETCLLKLHGQGSSRTDRILSRKEYDAHYGPRGAVDTNLSLPRVLSHAFQNMTLFFMGCSLVSDRTLEVFKAAMSGESRDGEMLPRHYALLADPGSNKRAGRRSELSGYNIFPIFYRYKDLSDHSSAVRAVLTSIQAHLEQ